MIETQICPGCGHSCSESDCRLLRESLSKGFCYYILCSCGRWQQLAELSEKEAVKSVATESV